ncbi:cg1 protein, putative [Plasmodium chabaudi chabaudi]|uniref:Cg1 protein, putative n=1 Tax=Plasmodium chabaudi chabaudi TaxID=31271 RepID=A0A4V0KBI0_PLACU|nr:cg1 protein, putative [Plasmodium chabaudi chabaudi]VTZ69674.1 cg1 protein, putative [Plasmodium chabaudi chabaudi]|eukprot:XP_016654253.1 cg1 protein, putative [Plasmodium chabaudi chabaudi]
MLIYLVLSLNILVCLCILNTKYQIQLDYTVPSGLLNIPNNKKYTNITIGNDSFICILTKANNDNSENVCDLNNFFFNNLKSNDINNYVQNTLKKNYLLEYANNRLNYVTDPTSPNEVSIDSVLDPTTDLSNSESDIKDAENKRDPFVKQNHITNEKTEDSEYKYNDKHVTKNNTQNENNDVSTFYYKKKYEQKGINISDILKCRFEKLYDYIFYKHKINVYHKNRTYENINNNTAVKNHIIKGKMLSINNLCIEIFSYHQNILKLCINKYIIFMANNNLNKFKQHKSTSPHLNDNDLLFSNNTVVQYYTDGEYMFEVLYLCGNNNLKVDSFSKLDKIYYPLIFRIYIHTNTNLSKLYNIILKKLENEIYFFKTFNQYTYSNMYYKTLKDKLNQIINSKYTNIKHIYRITLSAYMFCNYTDKINPPNHFLLRNVINKCYTFIKNDDYVYEVCLPNSVIKYKKTEYGNIEYPIIPLGLSSVSTNEGIPFYEKSYDNFPVLKTDYNLSKENYYYMKMEEMNKIYRNYIKSKIQKSSKNIKNSTNRENITRTSSQTLKDPFFSTPLNNKSDNLISHTSFYDYFFYKLFSNNYYSELNNAHYISTYMVDKPYETLKTDTEYFYKVLAMDLKGGKCKTSLDEIYDHITTIYFVCSLHYNNESHTKVVEIYTTTECHYYVHIASPYFCAHPTLHTAIKAQKHAIKCFKNSNAASSRIQNNNTLYNYSNHYKRTDNQHKDINYEKTISNNLKNNNNTYQDLLSNYNYVTNSNNIYSYVNHNKNNNFVFLEALPKDKQIEFGKNYDFGLGNYIRNRVYKNNPIFHIGNIVKHIYWNYHGVIISWDYICFAPNNWKKKLFLEYPTKYQNSVYYLILVSTNKEETKDNSLETNKLLNEKKNNSRDHNFNIQSGEMKNEDLKSYQHNDEELYFAYVPESSLVYSDQKVYNKYLHQFFERYNDFFHFYIPKKNHILWKLFPYDFFSLI